MANRKAVVPLDAVNATPSKLGSGPLAAGILLAANVVVPLVWGDVYPFTSAPMFRDNPRCCCSYRVLAPDGTQLPAEKWLCQRVYDGNPLGYGVGIKPPAVIEQEFGLIHEKNQVLEHIGRILLRPEHAHLEYVDVVQELVGPLPQNEERVGVVQATQFRVGRTEP